MSRIVFLATTRTGNDHRRHELVELALIERADTGRETTHAWWIRPTRLPDADPAELQRTKYFDRPQSQYAEDAVAIDHQLGGVATAVDPRTVATTVSKHLFGATVVTVDPAHDLPFLSRYLTGFGQLAAWAASYDMTPAARWAMYGLRHGWYAAARHAGLDAIAPPPLDYDLLDSHPGDPFVAAAIMGVPPAELAQPETALTRAGLARALWDRITTKPAPLPDPRPSSPPITDPPGTRLPDPPAAPASSTAAPPPSPSGGRHGLDATRVMDTTSP
ncbi:hypothetical protein [Nonomuraea sp. NPDC049646]|uniref:hypothetical protein n=1 Tax=unclassified Nonomuraea TaxID=2593643 RepID=UPI00378AFB44